ncbi:MAG: SOS response-associated peptidase [Ruminococcaceae bacterium]|nr:SOS response-associated peptidase [Oscillospiraceae bacterium]
MCGRYTGYIDDCEELKTIYTAAKSAYPTTEFASGEIFPTNTVPLLTGVTGELRPFAAAWGFPGFRGRSVIINARAETIAEKPTFAESFLRRRCIVPTTGYFEWAHSGERTKYLFRRPERRMLWLGALWQRYEDGVRFVILTTAANAWTADVHHRMPLILDESALIRWCADTAYAADYAVSAMPELVRTEA